MEADSVVQSAGILATSLALIAAPLLVGALLGLAMRAAAGGRRGGLSWAALCAALPLAAATALYARFPVIGLWDAVLETALLCLGTIWGAHRAFARRGVVLVSAAAIALSLAGLELACRWLLPPGPMFAGTGAPHLLLADALRANPELQPSDTRSKEIVCSIVYEGAYPGLLGLPPDSTLKLPASYSPRSDRTRRVLHLGDSMVYGLGVARDETLTAELERREPDTEHINGGIAGIAPDAYLAVLRRWVARHHVDLVVIYPFEGNDVRDVDGPYPCCGWQSLLAYDGTGASLRCPTPTPPELSHATWTWLRYNSPPPYLFRALFGHSVAARHLSARLVEAGLRASLIHDQPNERRWSHIDAIFRAARDELSARGIPLVVVALPHRAGIEQRAAGQAGSGEITELLASARRAGVPVLDASVPLLEAVARGEQPFLGSPDVHLSIAGHARLAHWLREQLATHGQQRAGAEPQASAVGVPRDVAARLAAGGPRPSRAPLFPHPALPPRGGKARCRAATC